MSFPGADEDGFGPDQILERIDVSRETLARTGRFLDLLDDWRTRLNLIGPGEGRRIWRRHVFDSLQLAPLLTEADHTIVDLGTGAGFPGMVLACAGVDLWNPRVTLVEKSPRKCEFLEAAVRELKLNATVLHQRSDEGEAVPADVVTARALAPLPRLLELASRWIKPEGRGLFLKGGDVAAELTLARESWTFDLLSSASLSDPGGQVLTIRKLLGRML